MEFVTQNAQLMGTVAVALGVLLALAIAIRVLTPRLLGRHGQRLSVVEYRELDRSRRLVLIRRDQTEHLLLIGGHSDVVVETGLAAPSAAPAPGASRAAPRPPAFGDRKAPALRTPGEQPAAASREEPAG
ncbi:MAG: flagellar biosynthetic protein FliO [Aestuariivirga sp.]|uniref:flagellar biosynthetic protein FliO n=1 Tax=Aestuariivirga sp. TaxID=2650926 RepID=UPI0038D06B87